MRPGHLSQSELDWAYAKRALSRGDFPESVITAIANYRRGDKPDPEYYARLTVRKAAQDLAHPTPTRDSWAGPLMHVLHHVFQNNIGIPVPICRSTPRGDRHKRFHAGL